MAIKSVEYQHKFHDHLVGGMGFYEVSEHKGGSIAGPTSVYEGDAINGRQLWNATCRSCHGAQGEGISGQGTVLNTSAYVRDHTNTELVEFVKVGRPANAPDSILQLQMPPRGGNPMLKDAGLHDIIAYLRTLQIQPATESVDVEEGAVEEVEVAIPVPVVIPDEPESFLDTLPRSTVPHAMQAPTGLAPESASISQRMVAYERPSIPQLDDNRPANAHLFFGLYFLMTGLHGIHVLVGMIVLLWLMWRLQRGDFSKRHYTAVECGGLYWHIVDVIWIFLFPLWYLIG